MDFIILRDQTAIPVITDKRIANPIIPPGDQGSPRNIDVILLRHFRQQRAALARFRLRKFPQPLLWEKTEIPRFRKLNHVRAVSGSLRDQPVRWAKRSFAEL